MKAKEKAKELINKFGNSQKSVFPHSILHKEHGKLDALICVDEILENILLGELDYEYYKEVRQEINKL
tara:strand:- start:174 stop:377 length:204 start_codon:yes stop_codon:yes gene_type:complete